MHTDQVQAQKLILNKFDWMNDTFYQNVVRQLSLEPFIFVIFLGWTQVQLLSLLTNPYLVKVEKMILRIIKVKLLYRLGFIT